MDGTDLWPHSLTQAISAPKGGKIYHQELSVASVRASIALGITSESEFPNGDIDDLMLLIVKEPDVATGVVTTAMHLYDKEQLLTYTIGLLHRLTADIGPERARVVMDAAKLPGTRVDDDDSKLN